MRPVMEWRGQEWLVYKLGVRLSIDLRFVFCEENRARPIYLSPSDGAILECLARHAPDITPHERITFSIWGNSPLPGYPAKGIQVRIHRLRKRIAPFWRIENIIHSGYLLMRASDPVIRRTRRSHG